MGIHLLTGDDESLVRTKAHDLIVHLVGDGERSLMVESEKRLGVPFVDRAIPVAVAAGDWDRALPQSPTPRSPNMTSRQTPSAIRLKPLRHPVTGRASSDLLRRPPADPPKR